MISQELAEKLKNAGLVWEPKEGDLFAHIYNSTIYHFSPGAFTFAIEMYPDEYIWLPRLDQLLAEIERLGYEWATKKKNLNIQLIVPSWEGEVYACEVWKKDGDYFKEYIENTPEEAAGQALLWILKQEAGK